VCVMKTVSWNIRGLGGFEKRKEVRNLVGEETDCVMYSRNKFSSY
jgi:hypothetical protein